MAGFANDFSTTLDSGITSGSTSLDVTTDLPSGLGRPFTIRIDNEFLKVTAVSGTGNRTWTVSRASEESSRFPAAAHSAGATVEQVVSAGFVGSLPAPGTAFPTSPATNDRFFRTDLGLEFYYDGTRWLTTTLFERSPSEVDVTQSLSATATFARFATDSSLDMYLVDARVTTRISSGLNDGSNYWTVSIAEVSPTNSSTTLGSFTTASSGTDWLEHTISINTAIASASFPLLNANAVKTASPGNLFALPVIRYRLIGV